MILIAILLIVISLVNFILLFMVGLSQYLEMKEHKEMMDDNPDAFN